MRKGQLAAGKESSTVLELRCNIDDMTAEAVGFAMDRLFEAGALDVWTTPAGMKHCRPGVILSVICHEEDREKVVEAFFRYTTTIGVREETMRRYSLSRSFRTVDTEAGSVRIKRSEGFGRVTEKPEYEDLEKIAKEQGMTLAEAAEILRRASRR